MNWNLRHVINQIFNFFLLKYEVHNIVIYIFYKLCWQNIGYMINFHIKNFWIVVISPLIMRGSPHSPLYYLIFKNFVGWNIKLYCKIIYKNKNKYYAKNKQKRAWSYGPHTLILNSRLSLAQRCVCIFLYL